MQHPKSMLLAASLTVAAGLGYYWRSGGDPTPASNDANLPATPRAGGPPTSPHRTVDSAGDRRNSSIRTEHDNARRGTELVADPTPAAPRSRRRSVDTDAERRLFCDIAIPNRIESIQRNAGLHWPTQKRRELSEKGVVVTSEVELAIAQYVATRAEFELTVINAMRDRILLGADTDTPMRGDGESLVWSITYRIPDEFSDRFPDAEFMSASVELSFLEFPGLRENTAAWQRAAHALDSLVE